MDSEKVFSLCTEGTLNLSDIGRGGMPEFTQEDARHSLAGMTKFQQYYTEYVFLLQDDRLKQLAQCLMECVLSEVEADKSIIKRLCEINCKLRRTPNKEKSIYTEAGISRGKWRSTYSTVNGWITHFLCATENEINYHIYKMTS